MGAKLRTGLSKTDYGYPLLCLLLAAISVVTLVAVGRYGQLAPGGGMGGNRLAVIQTLAAAVGLVGALVLSLLDLQLLWKYWPIHAAVCWGLVLLTFVPGIGYAPGSTGSQSWIALPFGMSLQPTELAKLSFLLTLSAHLGKVRDGLNRPRAFLPVLGHIALPVLLIHFQGDDGTAMVFLAIGLIMLVAAGINRWYVAGCIAAALAALPVLWFHVLSAHQKSRILGLFRPEQYADTIMYQQLQARTAVGAGGWAGRGLFQPDHFYVPRSENDFIFSFFAESFGFLGCLVLLGLLFALLFKILATALRAQLRAGAYLCVGVFGLLLFQTAANLGMNLMLSPVVGVTLPFLSAGGTSMLSLFCAIGLVMNVARTAAPKARASHKAAVAPHP